MSPHSFLVAAIFGLYLLLMGSLFAYIIKTGQPQPAPGADPDEAEREAEQAEMRLAALAFRIFG